MHRCRHAVFFWVTGGALFVCVLLSLVSSKATVSASSARIGQSDNEDRDLLEANNSSNFYNLSHSLLSNINSSQAYLIVGGTPAPADKYPSFVLSGAVGCGGVLIRPDVVLTAAHCRPIFEGGVFVGAHQVITLPSPVAIRKVVVHPKFSVLFAMGYDVMLVFLEQPQLLTPLAPLARSRSLPEVGKKVDVIGFGSTFEGDPGSSILMEAQVDVASKKTCFKQYTFLYHDDHQFCAGVTGGGIDSCQGDSGGPVFDENGLVVGLVSFGIGCARPDKFGVYARVGAHIGWIDAAICRHSVDPGPDIDCAGANYCHKHGLFGSGCKDD